MHKGHMEGDCDSLQGDVIRQKQTLYGGFTYCSSEAKKVLLQLPGNAL